MSTTENPTPTPEKQKPAINTLEAFAVWIDAELALLESQHEDFATKASVRNYLQRS